MTWRTLLTEYVPSPWEFVVLLAASYRIFRLIAEDDILDRPRRWFLRLPRDWDGDRKPVGDPIPDAYRLGWAQFITCPWCAGFWISVLWWLAWLAFGDWTLIAATPWAISAAVGATAHFLTTEEQ